MIFYQMILNDHVGKSSCQDLESRDSEAEMPKIRAVTLRSHNESLGTITWPLFRIFIICNFSIIPLLKSYAFKIEHARPVVSKMCYSSCEIMILRLFWGSSWREIINIMWLNVA